MNNDIFRGYGVEVQLKEEGNFLKVVETLTRMGIESKKTKTLYQSCHILHKRGRYAIMHFKEMFLMDGRRNTELSENDIERRNTIVSLLSQWGLVEVLDEGFEFENKAHISQIKILPYNEKPEWRLEKKYNIGNK